MTADEAQTEGPPPPATPESSEPEAFEFGIEIRMDATVTVNGDNWVKPGASTHKNWRIRNGLLPSRKELEATIAYMQAGVLTPVLSEMIDMIGTHVVEQQTKR